MRTQLITGSVNKLQAHSHFRAKGEEKESCSLETEAGEATHEHIKQLICRSEILARIPCSADRSKQLHQIILSGNRIHTQVSCGSVWPV
jgi:hypothetical protein